MVPSIQSARAAFIPSPIAQPNQTSRMQRIVTFATRQLLNTVAGSVKRSQIIARKVTDVSPDIRQMWEFDIRNRRWHQRSERIERTSPESNVQSWHPHWHWYCAPQLTLGWRRSWFALENETRKFTEEPREDLQAQCALTRTLSMRFGAYQLCTGFTMGEKAHSTK
jgi:hypothetical protein